MGLIFFFLLSVCAVVNFVGLCSVVISFIRCRTVPGYRNIAIIGAVFIPAILLFLTIRKGEEEAAVGFGSLPG